MAEQASGPRCWHCGRAKSDATALEALAWVRESPGSEPRWLCGACAREQVRNIESKLPYEYW